MKFFRYNALTTAVSLIALFSSFAIMNGAVHAETTAKSVMAVNTVEPQNLDWPVTVTASGSITAWQEAIIAAETGGLRITALYADVGDKVKRGQLLAELANASTKAELRRYEASLASAKASYAKAHLSAERARQLKGKGSLSDEEINDYVIAEKTAKADVDSADAQLQMQRITLSQTRIVAIDDGTITSKSAVLGQVVSTGTELFRIQRQSKLEWQGEVDARQLSKVHSGAKAVVTLPDGRVLDGSVRLVSPTLSTSTGRANVLVSLPDGSFAGMYAHGTINVGQKQALTVPMDAVVMRDGLSYVFEVGKDRHVIRHRVETGRVRDGSIEVSSGIKAGMELVASGGGFLADGDLVSVGGETK